MVEARFTKKLAGLAYHSILDTNIGHAFFPALMNPRGISS